MSNEVFDYEKDGNMEDKPFTWKDAHSIGNRMTKLTPTGVSKPSMNMGHGASCPDCSAGILQDAATELGRDSHFKASMKMHNDNLGSND
jgi:hypothetical protein